MMTNSNELVIEVCYLYCYAIKLLLKSKNALTTFNMTKEESKRRADQTNMKTIYHWIENDIEASKESEEMPILNHIPISYIKNRFSGVYST